jgi:phage protein D
MTTARFLPTFNVKFDGTAASREFYSALLSIEVDSSLTLPDMVSIHLRDPGVSLIDDDTYALGAPMEITASGGEGGTQTTIFKGEITALEPRFNATTGAAFVIRGYDKSHRLNRNRKTTTFVEMKDSDIASQIASDHGLTPNTDDTSQVHPYVIQDNQTDWEFLVARAQRNGYHLFMTDETLNFVQEPPSSGSTPELPFGDTLMEFNARLTAARQVSNVVVQGWDPENQEQILGEAETPNDTPETGQSEQGPDAAESAFGEATEIVVDRPVRTQDEADTLAQAICNEIGQGFLEADCVSEGNPAIIAGSTVEFTNLGRRFSGTYRIKHAIHRYDPSGYRTEFTVGGHHTATISELLASRNKRSGNKWAPVVGVVTNNEDPDGLGRVRVKIPSLSEESESDWARLVAPGAGPERGLQCIPEVNDEVLVAFEHGNIHAPLILGGLWSGANALPTSSDECRGSQGEINLRQMVSREGHKFIMSDDASDKFIEIVSSDENLKIKISEADSKIEIVSGGDLDIKAENGNVAVTAMEAAVEGTTKTEFKVGSGSIKIEPAGIEISNGSGAMIAMQGPTVNINNGALEVT